MLATALRSLSLSQSMHAHTKAYAPAHCACVASAAVRVLHFPDIFDFNVQKLLSTMQTWTVRGNLKISCPVFFLTETLQLESEEIVSQ